jgi:transposase
MATHYGICVIPARTARPRDKAKVEHGVLIAKRWIPSVLRHRKFYTLDDLNGAIDELLPLEPPHPAQAQTIAPRALFAFRSAQRFAIAPKALRVRRVEDSHRQHRLPHRSRRSLLQRAHELKGEKLQVRLTTHTVEVFRKGQRVACHVRSYVPHQHTTVKEHMPAAHQKYSEWSPARFIGWAEKTGPHNARLVQTIIESRAHGYTVLYLRAPRLFEMLLQAKADGSHLKCSPAWPSSNCFSSMICF